MPEADSKNPTPGRENKVLPYCTVQRFSKGDSLLICTDGLTDMVSEIKIQDIF